MDEQGRPDGLMPEIEEALRGERLFDAVDAAHERLDVARELVCALRRDPELYAEHVKGLNEFLARELGEYVEPSPPPSRAEVLAAVESAQAACDQAMAELRSEAGS